MIILCVDCVTVPGDFCWLPGVVWQGLRLPGYYMLELPTWDGQTWVWVGVALGLTVPRVP